MFSYIKQVYQAFKALKAAVDGFEAYLNQHGTHSPPQGGDEFVTQARAERAIRRAQRTS